ncbi:hypothetical protein PC128_g18341 [Phytophthora cactorum]|nr:hypothetical protein PC128_g18341 [Phytophthora cactorum]
MVFGEVVSYEDEERGLGRREKERAEQEYDTKLPVPAAVGQLERKRAARRQLASGDAAVLQEGLPPGDGRGATRTEAGVRIKAEVKEKPDVKMKSVVVIQEPYATDEYDSDYYDAHDEYESEYYVEYEEEE